MPRLILLLAALAILATLAAGPALAQRPVRALLVLGSPRFHDIGAFSHALEDALARVGGIQVTRLAPPDGMPEDQAHFARLAEVTRDRYDVLIFYTTRVEMGAEQERALDRFVREGGGLVGVHGASASFRESETWLGLIGARFDGHAPGQHAMPVQITDRDSPVTAGLADFVCTDEEYNHVVATGVDRHVIARFTERPPANTRENPNNDVAWTRAHGEGRVFYTALGHDARAWGNPAWQKMTLQGIFWAAGRPRTIDIAQEQ